MCILALDLGGTKLSAALFDGEGNILWEEAEKLSFRKGDEVFALIAYQVRQAIEQNPSVCIQKVGVAIPGVFFTDKGIVYAPNIEGWNEFPFIQKWENEFPKIPVVVASDRSCYILGEKWKGAAIDCNDVLFIAVGTGIGLGILAGGKCIQGAADIAGAIGWLVLPRAYDERNGATENFEAVASGSGIRKKILHYLEEHSTYTGEFKNPSTPLTASQLINAFERGDELAKKVIEDAILFWGRAAANLVSIFNPQKIIWGGGVFGPAEKFLPLIKAEADKWGQPLSMKMVSFEPSLLKEKAALYGAAYLTQPFPPINSSNG